MEGDHGRSSNFDGSSSFYFSSPKTSSWIGVETGRWDAGEFPSADSRQLATERKTAYQAIESRHDAPMLEWKQRREARMGQISGWEKERAELETLLAGQVKDGTE